MPDPLIQDPASTQNYNRYSYCLNNQLKYTDESGEFLVLKISLKGITIGWNYADIGIPLGFGINYDWSEPKGKIGGYIEAGIHNELDIFGLKVVPTLNVTAKVSAYHSFSDNSNSIEGELKVKYGNGFSSVETVIKGGIQFDKDWSTTKYSGSFKISGKANGFEMSANYKSTYTLSSKSWDNSLSIGTSYSVEIFEDLPFMSSYGAEVKYTYNFNKKESDLDFDLYLGNKREDESVFSSNNFKIIRVYSSRIKNEQELAKKGTKEYNKKKKTNSFVL